MLGAVRLGNWEFGKEQPFTQVPVGSNPTVSYICDYRPGKFNSN